MNISIETQNVIDELVASGRFASREEVIEQAVRFLDLDLKHEAQINPTEPSAESWCDQFESWALSHRSLAQEADDSRETIYQGRGE